MARATTWGKHEPEAQPQRLSGSLSAKFRSSTAAENASFADLGRAHNLPALGAVHAALIAER